MIFKDLGSFIIVNQVQVCFFCLIWLIGSLVVYFFGLKPQWQKLRIENSMVAAGDELTPRMFEMNQLGEYVFLSATGKLLLFSMIISMFICGYYIWAIPKVEFANFREMMESLLILLPIYGMFLDVSINTKAKPEVVTQNSKVFGVLYSFFAAIKGFILKSVIASERKFVHKCIKDRIRQWYEDWHNPALMDTKFGTFIQRTQERLLEDLLPTSDYDNIIVTKNNIIEAYWNKDTTLFD